MFIMTFGMTFGAVETAQAAKECGALAYNNNNKWQYYGYFGCIGRDKKCGSFEGWARDKGADWINHRVKGGGTNQLQIRSYNAGSADEFCKKAGFSKPRKEPFVCYKRRDLKGAEAGTTVYKAEKLGGTCMK